MTRPKLTKKLAFALVLGAAINSILIGVAIWADAGSKGSPLWRSGANQTAGQQSSSGGMNTASIQPSSGGNQTAGQQSSSSVKETPAVYGIRVCVCSGLFFQIVAAIISAMYGRGKITNDLWVKAMFGISGVFLGIGLVVIIALYGDQSNNSSFGIGWGSVTLSFVFATADNIKKVLSAAKDRVKGAAEGAQGE